VALRRLRKRRLLHQPRHQLHLHLPPRWVRCGLC
jgi:hypothetical protein